MFAAHASFMTAGGPSGPPFSTVVALLHFDTDLADTSSLAASWTASGAAAVSATQTKFGSKSLYVNGGYIYPSASASNFEFGTGDFTVEMWIYPTGSGDFGRIYDGRPGVQGFYPQLLISSNLVDYYVNSSRRITGNQTCATNTWSHLVLCRSSGSTRLFVNGTQSGSTWTDSSNYLNTTGYPRIGDSGIGTAPFPGYIDEVRITKAARYTAAFTAPTAAFPNG